MIRGILSYFADRHLLTNLIFLSVVLGGIFSWQNIKKEEMPDITFDRVRISASYPGATAQEVEHFVTKEIEEVLEGVDGIYRITSSASQGSTSITVELEQNYPNKDEAITEIRNAVSDADLPEDVRDDPSVRVFKTSKKAILDVALFYKDVHLLSIEDRQKLQRYAYALENQLVNLPEINSVNRSGYFQEEIQIKVDPAKLIKYKIPLSQVRSEIVNNNARQPAGNIEIKNEPKVTINAQLDTVEKLNALMIQAGFEGEAIELSDVAQVQQGFDQDKEIIKVNGHEAVMFNVVKNSSYGILESLDAVKRATDNFKANYLIDSPIYLTLLDDESIDVRNRLLIITVNGAIGFVLILGALFLFLNKRSGLWVAMGIPFTMFFTLIGGMFLGYTINNTTLAAVIIVMGIVVDDAIVVAENISRLRAKGLSSRDAAIEGTREMFLPVLASIVTTCVAFIPLFFFSGRHGQLNSFIPPIIFLMLGASLLESFLILPGHMHFELPRMKQLNQKNKVSKVQKEHWFSKYENSYSQLLQKVLPHKYLVFGGFILLMTFSLWVMTSKMSFVMFPNEETRDIVLSGQAPKDADRYQTAEMTKKIEEVFAPFLEKEVVGWRTEIARSRRGGAVEENKFRIIIEIVPKEKRRKSADALVKLWKPEIEKVEGLEKFTIQKSRWGQDSGSAIEVIIQENNDELRLKAAKILQDLMKKHAELINVEIEEPIRVVEYKVDYKREKIKRLSINPSDISAAFRSSLAGTVLYEIPKEDEEVDVKLSIVDEAKRNMESVLDIPVENNRDYLVPLRDVVTIEQTETPNSISRRDGKRTTVVYADIKPKSHLTPLKVAEEIEKNFFPQVVNSQPSTTMSFTGEVFDTRESKGDLNKAIILVVFLIFIILAVLFNSLMKPMVIMLSIPFGMVGVILAFWLHGKVLFGFFAAIGALGLAGVVINDSIIMLSKLDKDYGPKSLLGIDQRIADIAKTRLRAVILTTATTVAGVLPTAYGFAGYDAMLAEMMLALSWGLVFGTVITLVLIPCLFRLGIDMELKMKTIFH